MTALPLFQSIAQALTPNGLTRTERFPATIDAYDGNALSQASLAGQNLPYYGDPHPTNPLIVVNQIGIAPQGPGRSILSFTYGPPQLASGSQDVSQLDLADTTFEVSPATELARFSGIRGSKASTETVEIGQDGNPTNNTIGVAAASFEEVPIELEHDTARISLIVSGTATALGVDNTFGSVGAVPNIVNLSRTIHVIGGAALLFRGMDVGWTRNGPEGRIYTIRYEWRYESGVANTTANKPEDWTNDPGVGPSTGQWPITNSIGYFPVDGNGDAYAGIALPDVLALPGLRNVGHISASQRYAVPPYCDPVIEPDPSADFPMPRYGVKSRGFEQVDTQNTWQQFPGVS